MKNLFLLFATVTILVGVQACKQKEETTTEESTEVVVEDTATVAPVVVDTAAVAPADTTAK